MLRDLRRYAVSAIGTFLIISLGLAPALPAFANEAESLSADTPVSDPVEVSAPAKAESPDSALDLPVEDAAPAKTGEEEALPVEEEMAMSMQSDAPQAFPAIAPSTIKHQLPESDAFSGALVYSFPIVVPPGRNGMQPDLALTYNNQGVREDTLFGMGWSLNIPSIERINRKGSEKLYTENYFTSSLSGELVSLSSTSYKSKVDNGEFLDYTFSSGVWTVKDKSGNVYTFGSTAGARQDNPSDSTKVVKWMLEEVRDLNDNYVEYEYYKDGGQIYPYKIRYTGSGSTDGIFEVEFLRESRLDISVTYKSGFSITTNYRIDEIQTKVSGSWVKKYEIAYITGDNSKHSLIDTITETGRDETTLATVTLPVTDFNYQVPEDDIIHDSSWTLPIYLSNNADDVGARMVDVNNDGYTDILLIRKEYGSGPHTRQVYINDGIDGWNLDTNWTIPTGFYFSNYQGTSEGGQIADVNGDNLPDLLIGTPSDTTKKVYIHNGSGWSEDTNWVLPIYLSDSNVNFDSGVRLVDVNNDGLTDLLKLQGGSPAVREVYVNTGTGWSLDTSWTIPTDILFASNGGGHEGGKYADLNGDGLVDLFHRKPFNNAVYFNTGNGWVVDTDWSIPFYLSGSNGEDFGVRYMDLNGDGLTDFLRLFYDGTQIRQAWLNNGLTGWTQDTGWTLPTDNYILFSDQNGNDLTMRTADVNGDALLDLMYATYPPATNHKVWLHQGKRAEQLSRITFPRGGRTDITYKPSTQYFNGTTKLNPNLPMALDTVYQITNYDGLGVTATYTYKYEGGKYYHTGPYDRKFAGYSKVTKTDAAGNTTATYFHQGDSSNSSQGEYSDHVSKIGKAYRVEIANSSGNIYRKVINTWDKYDQGNGRNFVKMTQQLDFAYDGDSDHKDKGMAYAYDNANGNLTEKIDWGEVTGADAGTFTDTGTDKFTTAISYAANTTANILGLPSQETVTDQSSTKVRESKYYYDAQTQGNVNKGNLTKEEKWKTSTSYVDVERTYNTYGLVTQEKDPRDKTTDYTYDTSNLYPATVTNALSQAASYTYDYSSGQVKQVTDPNTRVYQTIYDGLDRVTEEKQPDITTPSTLVTKSAYAYSNLSVGASMQKTDYLDGTISVDAYTFTDGFDRVIQSRVEMEDTNTFSVTDTIYNTLEQVNKESLPYSSTGTSKTSATTNTDLLATYSYDPLMRVTTLVNVIGTVTNAYDDWKHSITDLRGKTKHLYQDAYGRLIKVEEINGASTYTTNYEYNGNGNLTKITDALSNVRNFTYDGLGRRLTAQDLHASADVTYGTWTYTYDDSSNVSSVVDPNSQTINYTYDDVNRALTEDYTGQTGTEVTYTYDSGTDGVGRLTSIASSGANTSYLYNALGMVKRETKTIDSVGYQTDYTHDRLGDVLTITNPDSSEVKYAYNTAGQLETVQRKESTDGSYINVVTDFDYGPHGKIAYQAYANGSATTNTYDATKLYRLSTKVTTITGGSHVQDLTYTMDNNGNITRIVDASATDSSKTVDYTYDDLNRMTSAAATSVASGQSTYSQTYEYNAIGNITSKTGQGSYTYAGDQGSVYANPHAVTSIGSTNFTYDNNGNLLTVTGGLSNTWNYKNQMTQAVVGSVTTTNTYDHAGQRVKYANSTTTTIYPSKNYNLEGGTQMKHIFAGDMLVATVKGTGASAAVYTTHTDHLSGSNVITNSGGTTEEVMDYFPFGEMRIDQKAGTFNEQRKYAGSELDADTGLNYMNARYYKSDIGRFVSQDPLYQAMGGDISRFTRRLADYLEVPQSLNSYTYVMNNPLMYVDPLGLETKVYLEKGNNADGASSALGHSFVEINRDGDSTVYNWSPGVGYEYQQNSSNFAGSDLEVTNINTLFDRSGKDNDTYNVYTFDTTAEQEGAISGYYSALAEQHLDSNIKFDLLSNNCVDVVVGALNAGGIVSNSFRATSFGVSTPGSLRGQFDHKYKAQNAGNRATRWWHNSKSKGVTMDISNSEVITTN